MNRIIGIDPGFGRIGFGIIEGHRDEWKVIDYGCIETSNKDPFIDRLEEINMEIQRLISKYNPTCAAVEDLFFYKNAKTAMKVSHARGVILLTFRQSNIMVNEFTPLQVKQSVVGYGRAEKAQVQKMVCQLLGIKNKKIQDDAADALATALACGVGIEMGKKLAVLSDNI